MSEEVWRPVAGYEGLYAVSDMGRVQTFWMPGSHKVSIVGRLMSPVTNYAGYKTVRLSKDGRARGIFVHRLVARAFVSNPRALENVNHKDGHKPNNAAANLEWVTPSENSMHAVNTGLFVVGERHPHAKLTEPAVRAIRASAKSCRKLGDLYGVDFSTVRAVRQGKAWKHVK